MELDTFDCLVDLPAWRLHLASLEARVDRDLGSVMDLATKGAIAALDRDSRGDDTGRNETISDLRAHLAAGGFDLRQTPLCSEILLRRIMRNRAIERGCLGWEFLSLLTAKSRTPWAALDRRTIEAPLVFREGRRGETLPTPDGPFACEGLPVLADAHGVKASPWTLGSPEDLMDATNLVLVCFLPAELYRRVGPKGHLGRLIWLTWAYSFVFERSCSYRSGR